jgi:hypothetical protein
MEIARLDPAHADPDPAGLGLEGFEGPPHPVRDGQRNERANERLFFCVHIYILSRA